MNPPKWIYAAIFIAVALAFLLQFGRSDLGLSVEAEGIMMSVTNVGREPVTIQRIVVNERNDCDVKLFGGAKFQPVTLKVGEVTVVGATCGLPVRAQFTTDRGTGTYTFRR